MFEREIEQISQLRSSLTSLIQTLEDDVVQHYVRGTLLSQWMVHPVV